MSEFGKASGGGRREDSRDAAPLSVVMTTFSTSYTAELVDISATGAKSAVTAFQPLGSNCF